MKKRTRLSILTLGLTLAIGCNFAGPEEQAIQKMLGGFVLAVQENDRDLAMACLMDTRSFMSLNPDAAARSDPEGFSESVIAEIVDDYRRMTRHFSGRMLKLKKVRLGTPWYQYKPHASFKDTEMFISVDGENMTIIVKGIVKVDNKWRIIDLSTVELY